MKETKITMLVYNWRALSLKIAFFLSTRSFVYLEIKQD